MTNVDTETLEALSDAVLELADRVGTAPIWEMLIHLGSELPGRARRRVEEDAAWQRLAVRLDEALERGAPEQIWARVRQALRAYEEYEWAAVDAEPPLALGVEDFQCRHCGGGEWVLFLSDPADAIGRCSDCGEGARPRLAQEGGAGELLDRRRQAIEDLEATRQMIAELDARNPYDNALTLVPLYRLEAQHMRRVRRRSAALIDLHAEPTTAAPTPN